MSSHVKLILFYPCLYSSTIFVRPDFCTILGIQSALIVYFTSAIMLFIFLLNAEKKERKPKYVFTVSFLFSHELPKTVHIVSRRGED